MRIFTDFNSKLVAWTALACCLCMLQVDGLSTHPDSGIPGSDSLSSNNESCVDHSDCETSDDGHETFLFNDLSDENVNSTSFNFIEEAMNFPCGSNTIVDVQAFGLLNNNNNCVNIANTNNMVATTVEVWIEDGDCGSGNLPGSIQIAGGGQTVTANGINVTQTSSSSVAERIYRARITGSFSQVCITGLGSCSDATSVALYTERTVNNASSFIMRYDSEFHVNGCEPLNLNIGTSTITRDFQFRVPIHEKSNDGRTVVLEADIRDGNSVLSTMSNTFTAQNAGNEAAFYVLNLNNVPQNADNVRVRVCSPTNNGDSFGVGSVVVSTNACDSDCTISCPPPIMISCEDSVDPSNTGMATSNGTACDNPTITFTDTFDGNNCPMTIVREWTVTAQGVVNTTCSPVTLAAWDFSPVNGQNLCQIYGGDPLQTGPLPSSTNQSQCSNNFGATRVSKDGISSCVQGAFGAPKSAVCVGDQRADNYNPNDPNRTMFEVSFGNGDEGRLTEFCFFERAIHTNENFGDNCPPRRFGFRVLKNNSEIYRRTNQSTSSSWTQRCFNLASVDPDFNFDGAATYKFELIGYDPACNQSGAEGFIWELDEFVVRGCCGDTSTPVTLTPVSYTHLTLPTICSV